MALRKKELGRVERPVFGFDGDAELEPDRGHAAARGSMAYGPPYRPSGRSKVPRRPCVLRGDHAASSVGPSASLYT